MDTLNLGLAAINLAPLPLDLPPETRQRSLRFMLGAEDSALVPLEQITEMLKVEIAAILPVPGTSPWVLGVCNWRGEMLWLIDLCDFVGYPSPFQPNSPSAPMPTAVMVMVVQINHQFVGIGVQQVSDIEQHDMQQLQPVIAGLFPPGLLPLVVGLLPGGDAVFNLKAIAECSL